MIQPPLTFVALLLVSVPYILLFSPGNCLLLFEHAMLVHTSAPLPMLFPLLNMPSSLSIWSAPLVMTHPRCYLDYWLLSDSSWQRCCPSSVLPRQSAFAWAGPLFCHHLFPYLLLSLACEWTEGSGNLQVILVSQGLTQCLAPGGFLRTVCWMWEWPSYNLFCQKWILLMVPCI